MQLLPKERHEDEIEQHRATFFVIAAEHPTASFFPLVVGLSFPQGPEGPGFGGQLGRMNGEVGRAPSSCFSQGRGCKWSPHSTP